MSYDIFSVCSKHSLAVQVSHATYSQCYKRLPHSLRQTLQIYGEGKQNSIESNIKSINATDRGAAASNQEPTQEMHFLSVVLAASLRYRRYRPSRSERIRRGNLTKHFPLQLGDSLAGASRHSPASSGRGHLTLQFSARRRSINNRAHGHTEALRRVASNTFVLAGEQLGDRYPFGACRRTVTDDPDRRKGTHGVTAGGWIDGAGACVLRILFGVRRAVIGLPAGVRP